MNKFWTWIIKESGYAFMYIVLAAFLSIAICSGTVIAIVFTLFVTLIGTLGVISHYRELKKLGKWDENSDYDKTYDKK